jgi:hypothetical protein
MSCECQSGLGAIPQQLGQIGGGAAFQFGFNVGYTGGGGAGNIVSAIGDMLNESGLAYDAHSYQVAGVLNPFITVEGNAVTTWPSATDFAQAIYNAIVASGFPVDYGSIQFRYQGDQGSAQWSGTPYQTPQTTPTSSPGACDLNAGFGSWVACELGIKDPLTGAALGSAGTAIGIGAILLVTLLLIKR